MKQDQTYELNEDQIAWLEAQAKENNLPDASKALRCLLDYAMQDGDADDIFGTIRCHHC